MRRLLWPSILIIVAGIVIAIWLTMANQPEDTLTRAQRLGVIRVGYAPESPFAFRSMGGAVTGESPEIIRLMLANLGITKIEWVQTDWASLIPNLNAGRFDIIAAGMFITCERAQLIDFTRPTYQMNEALLVRKGNPKNIHSYRDFVGTSAVLAVVDGAQEQHIAHLLGVPDANLVAVPDAQTGLAIVEAGRADALALTSVSLRMFAKQHDTVEVAEPFDPPMIEGHPVLGYGAFGIRKDDVRLRQALDRQLTGFLGSQAHSDLVEPFGFTKSELPHSDGSDILASCGAHAIPSDPSP